MDSGSDSFETLAHSLAWQVEMGADEALSTQASLMRWGAEKPKAQAAPTQTSPKAVLSKPAPLDSLAAWTQAPKTLEDLQKALLAFEGCPLKQTSINLVFGAGNPQADIMIIGDVPGEEEDRQGRPFAGAAGVLLGNMLKAIGLKVEDVYCTNLVFWRPPGNRKPTDQEVAACLPFTRQHIALVAPKILLALGALPAQNLLSEKTAFNKIRGRWQLYKPLPSGEPIACLPLYHPSYLLHQPAAKRQAWADLLLLQEKVNGLSP